MSALKRIMLAGLAFILLGFSGHRTEPIIRESRIHAEISETRDSDRQSQIRSQDWLVHHAGGFRIYHTPGQAATAERVGGDALSVAAEYARLLALAFPDETFIFLVDSDEKWEEMTRGSIPDWSDGFAKSQNGIVYIRLHGGQNLRAVLRHELIHIILGGNLPPGSIPRWFEEGLASFSSSDYFMDHHTLLSMANLSNSLLALTDIDEVLAFNKGKAKLAYAQSLAGFKLIWEAVGWEGIRAMLADVNQGKLWSQVFASHLEMSQEDFDWHLQQHIARRFKWDFIYQFETWLWTLIPLLVVAGFVAMRVRRKKIYRRWQAEDESQSEPDLDEE